VLGSAFKRIVPIVGLVAGVLLPVVLPAAVAGATSGVAVATSGTFGQSEAQQQYIVPSGVTEVTITAIGGRWG
jgi:hypothetical protein